ncbi:hypothetical protein HNR59_003950 [Aquamicrobium lusatiense]|uniref:Transposase n=1 Tax=Aquamicrobium lusatiense TaxID=89772 RepID=A0A7W9S5Q8_9HYPH|nr:hypothetical protein [Aquamicrobium lusatiense]
MLCFIRHALTENRCGRIVEDELTQADCHAARRAGHSQLRFPETSQQLKLETDKEYDAAGFVANLRHDCVILYVARKVRYSAINGRTARYQSHALSRKPRKRIEEPFGGRKPSVAWHRPSIAVLSACDPTSS